MKRRTWIGVLLPIFAACSSNRSATPPDRPRIGSHLVMRDIVFHSASLNREMPYRAFVPADLKPEELLPVVYLLHGGGGEFRDWSNYSDVGRLCDLDRWIVVMPEGGYSYYTNSVSRSQDRFEDYFVSDLAEDVERRFHAIKNRRVRAVIGVSMGGYGAIKLALRHPDRFVFAGALSAAVDVPRRKFTILRASQWRDFAAIFGPQDGVERRANDPFELVRSVDPSTVGFLYLWCGESEGLIAPNREFASALAKREFNYEFHSAPGAHDWGSWNRALAQCVEAMRSRIAVTDLTSPSTPSSGLSFLSRD